MDITRLDMTPVKAAERGTMAGPDDDDDDDENEDNRITASLAALAVVLFIAVVAVFLLQKLRHEGAVEDCLMSGRTNCLPLTPRDGETP